MAFKVNNPLKYTDPGKKLPKNPYPGNTTAGLESTKSFKIPAFLGIENTPDKDRATVERFGGSKVNSPYSSDARKRLNILNSASTTPIDPSKNVEIKTKIKSKTTQAGEAGYAADDLARKNKTGIYAPKKKKIKDREPSATNTETKASGRQSKLSQTSLGKKGKQKKFGDEVTMQSTRNNKKSTPKENTLDAINKVSMKKFVPASKKTTTVKSAPKNSRSDIKARKTADKKAGVSKSQMRANKAKSKSEAASAKAKKSKNPSYRAQLTAKSERLAKRAARKGGSPAKKAK
jgi:hypothetical protein